jgi:hypothetical protein
MLAIGVAFGKYPTSSFRVLHNTGVGEPLVRLGVLPAGQAEVFTLLHYLLL